MIPVYEPWLTDLEKGYAKDAIDSGWISSRGSYVDLFERQFADKFGYGHAIAINTGTAAVHLALLAAGIQEGDEVLVPNITFVATANAVKYCGAKPILVDVEKHTWNICPIDAEKKITSRTKAIMPVHLYGSPANMEALEELGVPIIEDACEALGATFDGQYVGKFSNVAAFSFFGNKTITTGEGGMVVTADDEVAHKVRLLKGQGQTKQYWHPVVGYNYRMTNIQAAIGLAQLERFDEIKLRKDFVRRFYITHLKVKMQGVHHLATHGCWMNAIEVDKPSELADILRHQGIDTRPSFYPLSYLPPYGIANLMDGSEYVFNKTLVLPSSPTLSEDDLFFICNTVNQWI